MAKRSALSKGLGTAGKMTRNNLERLGSFIDSVNAKSGKPKQFKAVDLENKTPKNDLLREQTLKASQQLLGPRFATYGKYAKKVVPDSMFSKAMDSAFAQIAKLAASWSQLDLPEENRLAGVKSLDNEQRYALATDIANQNRALATLGGVTGLAGLPGMLADTLWLLLVSLRTVYQIAAVYDQPLTGKQGIKMAYELLSSADLSKMQEKQALLAGLGVAKGLLDKADNQGLRNELKNVGLQHQNVSHYAEQIDKIAQQFNIDIDHVNLSWMTKLLPVTSVAVGMHYNSHLIEEVIGVAQATFAPDAKLANRLLSSSTDQESEVKSDSEGSDKSEKLNKKSSDDSSQHQADQAKDDSSSEPQDNAQDGDKKSAIDKAAEKLSPNSDEGDATDKVEANKDAKTASADAEDDKVKAK
ncbi:EcsC family protein [Psychrobacter pygoscelis]|uniref:EcsC family protein n=1 Tax=Psychrobacter pygoscelis TaxID=2488563 RepID=UPI0010400A0B|nr:EcsC family protein [Psychrobacter pygoscelis]